jgi:2,3,4,5-tetrahydropyridine-2,6-dicarboxylate N-succinyltransferase
MDFSQHIQTILDIDPRTAMDNDRQLLTPVWEALRSGALRSAERRNGTWCVNIEVKQVILWAFKAGLLVDFPPGDANGLFSYTDKNTLPVQRFDATSGRRVVPGGSSVRDGSYVARGVIIMPPSYINVGAYVDEDTMIDSHALVGSCAQIGKRVHVSAAVQIGGVLEPSGAMPVIIEDDVMIGGNAGIYEGTIVRERCVIGTGVILNASTPVFDLVHETIYRRSQDGPMEIPAGAVVVQGSRPAKGPFAETNGLHLYTPVIVKYRDEKTDAATALEEALRS